MDLKELLSKLDWDFNIQKQDNLYYVELEHFSPLGEDVIDVIWLADLSADSFIDGLEKYKTYIEERYEEDAELYIRERPNGTENFSARQLIQDVQDKTEQFEDYYLSAKRLVENDNHTTCTVTAYPCAIQNGKITVPTKCKNIRQYIEDNWDSIIFDEPELNYEGTDFDYQL